MTTAIGTTDVDIAANTCILLGLTPISSFDGSDKASVLENVYPFLRDSMLQAYPWRFTMNKRQLSRLSATPVGHWTYGFQLPSDRLGGPRAIYPSGSIGERSFTDFEIFGDKIFTDETVLYADYQIRIDESLFPPHFTQLMIYALAANTADALTDEMSKAEYWQAVAFGPPGDEGKGGYFRHSRQIDAQQSVSQVIDDFSLIAVRS